MIQTTLKSSSVLAALVAERQLQTRGFHKSMCALALRFDDDVREWLGDYRVKPAAYKIMPANGEAARIYDVTVHVYEVEKTREISDEKLCLYGFAADSDGPRFDLHIIDCWDREIVVPGGDLMTFALFNVVKRVGDSGEYHREILKRFRAHAVAQHHAPVVDHAKAVELRREINRLKGEVDNKDADSLMAAFEEVIYGLGCEEPQAKIARRAGVSRFAVRALASLLKAHDVNPKQIVKDSQAKWKAAYDAVRELGVQL